MSQFSTSKHLSQKRINFGLFKIDVLNYIEGFFGIEHMKTIFDDYIQKSEYRILNTDIDMKISSYITDSTIRSMYLCTWENGFTASQKSLVIDYNFSQNIYTLRDISVSDYRTPLLTKDEVFKALSNYFNSTYLDMMRDKKLEKIIK